MIRRNPIISAIVALMLFAVAAAFVARPNSPTISAESIAQRVLGKTQLMPDSSTTVDGSRFRRTRPVAAFFVHARNLASCVDYPMEMRVLQSGQPQLQVVMTVFVDSPAEERAARQYAARYRLENRVIIDASGSAVASIARDGSFVSILTADGRVLFVDDRAGGSFAAFSTARILAGLVEVLQELQHQ